MQSFILYLQNTFTLIPGLYLGLVVILGLLVGSFLNVVIVRLPIILTAEWQKECASLNSSSQAPISSINLITTRSHCPQCNTLIPFWYNIPILGYLILRGRCHHCKNKISPRYVIVEILTAFLLVLCAFKFGFSIQAFWAIIFTLSLISLTFIDLEHQILPDNITLPTMWLGLGISLWNLFIPVEQAILGAMVGYLSLWAIYWIFKWITGKEGIGYGDFKLLALLGAWLGWQALPMVLFGAALSGAIIGISLRINKRLEPNTPIPFGPFLAIAGWLSLMYGDKLPRLYFQF